MGRRAIRCLDIAVKVAVIALLLRPVANPEIPRYSGTLGGAVGAAIVGLRSPHVTGSRSPREG